jgi:uncharacterized protein (DUF885 family)
MYPRVDQSILIMRRKFLFLLFSLLISCTALPQNAAFGKLCADFMEGYRKLELAPASLDYKTNFENIKNSSGLRQQEEFFQSFQKKLEGIKAGVLNASEKIRYAQLMYETNLNLERVKLEKQWNSEGRHIPPDGLHSMSNYKAWYSYYIKYFTSVNISPEEVFTMGEKEVKKVQQQISDLRERLGFPYESSFYTYLHSDTFLLTDKQDILNKYAVIDKSVREGLCKMYPCENIPAIGVMEWPDATATTPPGMYLDKENNSYGKDVFLFNFYGQKHNRRCMEWLYMHEGIPGHHLQSVIRQNIKTSSPLQNEFFYFGNSEGWACYVEDFGKEIGMYKDPYTFLGKWEWDLVRSGRLVMEVGIHYYGWSSEKAMQYWKENIMNQDEIAGREISRITKWAGQALCYKVGALTLKKIAAQKMKKGMSPKDINTYFLNNSDVPLQVLEDAG